eukprot:SRR837773.18129.p1 GENE.SRR837773.18129~~SRR837773.18129.p1  ORF type:complete len:366 (+),score=32.04 SRR837773.18129:130-1098(+)
MGLAVYSWIFAPFLYNPRHFDSPKLVLQDLRCFVKWLAGDDFKEEQCWEVWSARLQDVKKGSSLWWLFFPTRRLILAACSAVLVMQVCPDTDGFFGLMPPFWMALVSVPVAFLKLYNQNLRIHTRLLAPVALVMFSAEIVIYLSKVDATTRPAVLLYKYMVVRCGLDFADWIAAHRPCGCALSLLHESCQAWSLSVRMVRDFLVGVVLCAVCFLIACIPGVHWLHQWFLHRAQPREGDFVQGFRRRPPPQDGAPPTTSLGSGMEGASWGDQHRNIQLVQLLESFAPPPSRRRSSAVGTMRMVSSIASLNSEDTPATSRALDR